MVEGEEWLDREEFYVAEEILRQRAPQDDKWRSVRILRSRGNAPSELALTKEGMTGSGGKDCQLKWDAARMDQIRAAPHPKLKPEGEEAMASLLVVYTKLS